MKLYVRTIVAAPYYEVWAPSAVDLCAEIPSSSFYMDCLFVHLFIHLIISLYNNVSQITMYSMLTQYGKAKHFAAQNQQLIRFLKRRSWRIVVSTRAREDMCNYFFHYLLLWSWSFIFLWAQTNHSFIVRKQFQAHYVEFTTWLFVTKVEVSHSETDFCESMRLTSCFFGLTHPTNFT